MCKINCFFVFNEKFLRKRFCGKNSDKKSQHFDFSEVIFKTGDRKYKIRMNILPILAGTSFIAFKRPSYQKVYNYYTVSRKSNFIVPYETKTSA